MKQHEFLEEINLINEEECKSARNLSSNMKHLGKSINFSNPSRNSKPFSTPDRMQYLQKKSNEIEKNHSSNHGRSGYLSSGKAVNSQSQSSSTAVAEENIQDGDLSSSEFDVSENEATGPTHGKFHTSQLAKQSKEPFFNVKIAKDIAEQQQQQLQQRKSRCHTLLPHQAQKYFRDTKHPKSYIQPIPPKELQLDPTFSLMISQTREQTCASVDLNESRNRSFSYCVASDEDITISRLKPNNNNNNNNLNPDRKPPKPKRDKPPSFCPIGPSAAAALQSGGGGSLAQVLPESVLDASKFNLNFNSAITSSQQHVNSQVHLSSGLRKFSSDLKVNSVTAGIPSSSTAATLTTTAAIVPSLDVVKVKMTSHQTHSNLSVRNWKFDHQDSLIKNQDMVWQRSNEMNELQQKPGEVSNQKSPTLTSAFPSSIEINEMYRLSNANALFGPNVPLQQSDSQNPKKQSWQLTQTSKPRAPSLTRTADVLSENSKIELTGGNTTKRGTQDNSSNLHIERTPMQSIQQARSIPWRHHRLLESLATPIQSDALRKPSKQSLNDQDLLYIENDGGNLGVAMPSAAVVGTFNTIDVRVDTMTIRTTKQLMSTEEMHRIVDQELFSSLIKAIFGNQLLQIQEVLKRIANDDRYHIVNWVDEKGNTPLLLAVKLAFQNKSYFNIAKLLLNYDADPRIRDSQGWSCFEEVASQSDVSLTGLIFENLISSKIKQILLQKREIDNMLAEVPDFYMEMKWEFESNLIPFVSKFAPSDTFKIWKYGRSIRCDSTFAGLQNYRSKRRAQSLIFNSLNMAQKAPKTHSEFDFLSIIHKEEKTFHFPLEELDEEEKKKIVSDLLSSTESISGNLKILQSSISPAKSFFGNKQTSKVQGYKCDKFDLQLRYKYVLFKKTRVPFLTSYDRYMSYNSEVSPLKSHGSSHLHQDSIQSERRSDAPLSCQTSLKEFKLTRVDQAGGIGKAGVVPFDLELTESKPAKKSTKSQNDEKKQTLQLFVSEDFPMKFKAFMPLLSFLSNGNPLLANLYEVFKDQSVSDVLFKKGFPVKVQIPLSYSIYANITFAAYKPLVCDESDSVQNLFNIPEESVFVPRKIKQNTLKKQKKRLLLANLYLS